MTGGDTLKSEAACPIAREEDLVGVRTFIRRMAKAANLSTVEETKLVTAGSELARNILRYAGAGGGELRAELVESGTRKGVRAVFSDHGPGIADIALAMKDGFSTAGSLGLGLPGSKRLVDEFDIASTPGRGTVVTVIKWATR